MASNNSSSNSTAEATLQQSSAGFCQQYPDALREDGLDNAVPYIINAALNVPSAVMAIFGNMLIFLAIRRSTSIRLPSKLLLYTLFLTDFAAGSVAQPLFVVLLIMKAQATDVNCFLAKSLVFVATMLSSASLQTMTAISLDRYIAVFYNTANYHEIVTTKRVSAVLFVIGCLSVAHAVLRLLSLAVFNYISPVGFVVCVFVISLADIRLYRRLRQHNIQTQPSVQAGQTMYRRLSSTMMWIYAVFIGCYVPYFFVFLVTRNLHDSALKQCIREFFYTILFYNSSFNPFVYYWRLPEIREEVLRRIRNFCGLHSPPH